MKVIVATDSFKGSLTSIEAVEIIGTAFKEVNSGFEIVKIPLSDGGEGFVESIFYSSGGELIESVVSGPLPGQKVNAKFLIKDKTAIIEMASASGLLLVPKSKRNPKITTTYGVGELIRKALDLGAEEIVIGVGGSATNDGGAGMAQALGYRLLDKNRRELKQGGINLLKLHKIDDSEIDPRIKEVKFKVAVDVLNPMCGPEGSAFVYAIQKGARRKDLPLLDKALEILGKVVADKFGVDIITMPGAGAAGGLAGGLVAFCNAEIIRGIDFFLDFVNFDEKVKDAKLIITGEGKIDGQVKFGKALKGLAERAEKYKIPVIAFAGKVEGNLKLLSEQIGVKAIFPITSTGVSEKFAMANAKELLFNASYQVAKLLNEVWKDCFQKK